jgi:hypothetical protein
MLSPVVFLILPITVVFAVFPSMVVLRVGLRAVRTRSTATSGSSTRRGRRMSTNAGGERAARRHRLVGAALQRFARSDRERGDVPGWVLVTLMTAGLVTALWLVAGPALRDVFTNAINGVKGTP